MHSCNRYPSNGCHQCSPGALRHWSKLDPVHAQALDRISTEQHCSAGDWIFRAGSPCTGLYCVAEGIVGQRLLHPNGADVLLEIAYPGDLVGAPAFLRGGLHRTSAEALTDVRLCRLPALEVRRLMAEYPSLYPPLVKVCLDALDASQDCMLQAAAMSNRDRLLQLLRRLLEHCGKRDGSGRLEARLPVSREDIAGMLGVRQETLSRLLKRLSDEQQIEISGRHCQLLARTSAAAPRRPITNCDTTQAVGF
jgi:CRP/FNR family transcriptional regulator